MEKHSKINQNFFSRYDIESEVESDDYTPALVPTSSVTARKPSVTGENSTSSDKRQVINEASRNFKKDQNKNGSEKAVTRPAQSPREMSAVTPFTTNTPSTAKETDFSMFEVAKSTPTQPSSRGPVTEASPIQPTLRDENTQSSSRDQRVIQQGLKERIIPISERDQSDHKGQSSKMSEDSSDSSELDPRGKNTEPTRLKR